MTNDNPPESPREQSLWLATTPTTEYGPLEDGLEVDIAVIGGGITGLTAAIELKEAGRSVAVVEADRIVESTTGHTTAKLTSQHGLIYDTRSFPSSASRRRGNYADANEAAIDHVEQRIEEADIDCDFRRTEAYTYAVSPDDLGAIRDEVSAAQQVGLPPPSSMRRRCRSTPPARSVSTSRPSFTRGNTCLLSIAEQVHGDGSHVFEETRALEVDPGSPCRVETEHGEVVADDVVVATHFPVLDRAGYFARMHPHRAYLLAVRVAARPLEGMFYSTDSPPATMRTYSPSAAANGGSDGGGSDDGELLPRRWAESHA